MHRSARLALLVLVLFPVAAGADERLVAVEPARTYLWPATLDVHVVGGVEPHGARGVQSVFGIGTEVMWRGVVGGFVQLVASSGSNLKQMSEDGKTLQALGDRISVPFGLAVRPLGGVASRAADTAAGRWGRRLAGGIGLQAGVTVEYLRSSDDNTTSAGFHLAASVDVPLWGGPLEGGVALRLQGRLIVTPEMTLEKDQSIEAPVASGQFFAGIAYYP